MPRTHSPVCRLGAAQGLTIRGTKRIFDPTPAHVGLLQARDDGVFRAFHDLAFERVFRRELDPDDPAHIRAVLAEAGGDVDAWFRCLRNGAAELGSDRSPCRGAGDLRGPELDPRRRALLGNGHAGANPATAGGTFVLTLDLLACIPHCGALPLVAAAGGGTFPPYAGRARTALASTTDGAFQCTTSDP